MAEANLTTLKTTNEHILGIPLSIPDGVEHDISVILRVIIAMAEEFNLDVSSSNNDPYEVLVRRLVSYQRNLDDIASRIKQVVGHE